MDRRAALRILAAGGVGLGASTVVSSRALADGGSPVGTQEVQVFGQPAFQGGSQFGPTFGTGPDTTGALFGNFITGTGCLNGGTIRRQYRVSRVASTGVPLILTVAPAMPLDTWTTVSDGYVAVTYRSATGASVVGSTLTLRLEHRVQCCRPGFNSWRCFEVVATASFVGSNNTTVASTSTTNSLNCENPAPVCS